MGDSEDRSDDLSTLHSSHNKTNTLIQCFFFNLIDVGFDYTQENVNAYLIPRGSVLTKLQLYIYVYLYIKQDCIHA